MRAVTSGESSSAREAIARLVDLEAAGLEPLARAEIDTDDLSFISLVQGGILTISPIPFLANVAVWRGRTQTNG
jgi:hypothetical protein